MMQLIKGVLWCVVAYWLIVYVVGPFARDHRWPNPWGPWNSLPIETSSAVELTDGQPITGVSVTAYSSRVKETDSTPFVTAAGTTVRDGVVACNWLPIGTRLAIPDHFGERQFVVEDRMSSDYDKYPRNRTGLDVWMGDTSSAKEFGSRTARIILLNAIVVGEGGDKRVVLR